MYIIICQKKKQQKTHKNITQFFDIYVRTLNYCKYMYMTPIFDIKKRPGKTIDG